jgi:hypothetical protein
MPINASSEGKTWGGILVGLQQNYNPARNRLKRNLW